MKINDIITDKKFVIHINGRAISTYDNLRDARGDVYELQKNNPKLKVEIRQEVCRDEPLPGGTMSQSGLAEAGSPAQQAAIAIAMKKAGKKPKSKNQLNEFDPGSGNFGRPPVKRRPPPSGGDDGEQNDGTGSWFNDSDIEAIVGEGWTQELDLSFGHGDFESGDEYGRRIKAAIIDEAQNWLHENGYQARIIDVKNNEQRENLDWLIQGDLVKLQEGVAEGSLNEFAPGKQGGDGDYLRALASAWYNDTFNTGSLQQGIKSQEDVERVLARGIVCPDGKTRKYNIDYNGDFDGVQIYSDDYYEHGDVDGSTDTRTGRPFGPYDHIEFKGQDLNEGIAEGSLNEKCWDTHRQVGMKKKGNRMVPNCVPKESIEEATICSECGGPSYSNPMLAEKKDACYHKVKSRVKVWPSAYASGQLVQCRRRGAKNWGTGGKKK